MSSVRESHETARGEPKVTRIDTSAVSPHIVQSPYRIIFATDIIMQDIAASVENARKAGNIESRHPADYFVLSDRFEDGSNFVAVQSVIRLPFKVCR